MHEYFLTSIQPLIGIKVNSIDDWINIIPIFVKKVLDYTTSIRHDHFDNNQMTNLCFESYCSNRTTFSGKVHTELAVGYDHDGINLLGLFNKGIYIPHFNLPRYIFTQPFYLHIHETKQVFELMDQLDKVVLGTLDEEEFLKNFVLDEFTSRVIHPEGFVLLTLVNGIYDYAKIKTKIYYKCHKIHKKNINELLDLPENSYKYFPILKTLHTLFDPVDITIIKKLVEDMYESLLEVINKNFNKDSDFYKINRKSQPYIDDIINKVDLSIFIYKFNEVYNIIINKIINTKNQFGVIINNFYQNNSLVMIEFSMKLLMEVKPWYGGWEDRLSTLFTEFPSIYEALMELDRRNSNNQKNKQNQTSNEEADIKLLIIKFQRLQVVD